MVFGTYTHVVNISVLYISFEYFVRGRKKNIKLAAKEALTNGTKWLNEHYSTYKVNKYQRQPPAGKNKIIKIKQFQIHNYDDKDKIISKDRNRIFIKTLIF